MVKAKVIAAPTKFVGFPAEGARFFMQLEADNSKDFWHAHKDVYESAIRGPMEALLAELADEFGEAKVFRPNRDIRFSHDKSPYKTNCSASISGRGYVSFGDSGIYAGAGRYMLDGPGVVRFRAAVDRESSGAELAKLVASLEKKGYEFGGEALKTVPRGFAPDHPRARLLRNKGLHGGKMIPAGPALQTRAVLGKVQKILRDLAPLVDWHEAHVD